MDDKPPAAGLLPPDFLGLALPDAETEAIAAQLERDTGCSTIDRAALACSLGSVIDWYWLRMDLLPSTRKVRSHHHEKLETAYRRYQEFESSLREACETGYVSDSPTVLGDARRIGAEIALGMRQARSAAPHRGQPSTRKVRGLLFDDLAEIYAEHTGRRAGTSTIRDRHGAERRGGPFVNFVEMVVALADPNARRSALGTSVAAALRGRRAKELEPR